MKKTNKELETRIMELSTMNEKLRTVNEKLEGENINLAIARDNLEHKLFAADQLNIALVQRAIDFRNPQDAASKVLESLFKLPLSTGTEFVCQLHANFSEYLRLTEGKRRNQHAFSRKMLEKLTDMSSDVVDGKVAFER